MPRPFFVAVTLCQTTISLSGLSKTSLTETYRRIVLRALRKEDRLSEDFSEKLLTFQHAGGFSVYGRNAILNAEPARLAHLARYATRPPVAVDRVSTTIDGKVLLALPDGDYGEGGAVTLDPLEWIRRLTWHIPDPRMHTIRYYGAYANRTRARYRPATDGTPAVGKAAAGEPVPKSRASWARLIRRVFECDPLACPRCGAEMRVIAFLTDPAVIDRILRHLEEHPPEAPFDARAPPAA